jgi:hypothetical protein
MIRIETKKGDVGMTLTEFARWACLVEAYLFIENKAQELGINPINMIKPLAIEKYINERYHAMLSDVQYEYDLGILV